MNLTADLEGLPDEALIEPFRQRDEAAIRVLTSRYNQRLYRVARAILKDESEAEDVVQETYIRALTHLDTFRGDARFSTWITRIAVNESLGRLRKRRPTVSWDDDTEAAAPAVSVTAPAPTSPEQMMSDRQLRDLMEESIDGLPDAFRVVFVARMIEGLSVDETAVLFGLRPETVKTRVHRARARIRRDLEARVGTAVPQAFAFDGARCARLTDAVLTRLRRR